MQNKLIHCDIVWLAKDRKDTGQREEMRWAGRQSPRGSALSGAPHEAEAPAAVAVTAGRVLRRGTAHLRTRSVEGLSEPVYRWRHKPLEKPVIPVIMYFNCIFDEV